MGSADVEVLLAAVAVVADVEDLVVGQTADAITVAIAASVGIEVYVWLRDVAGLDPGQAADTLCWTAETIFLGAIHADAPPPPPAATRQLDRFHEAAGRAG